MPVTSHTRNGIFRKRSAAMLLFLAVVTAACRQAPPPEQQLTPAEQEDILRSISTYRAEADSFFRANPDSPFRQDTTIRFTGLRWYPPSIEFVFRSALTRFAHPGTVIVYGTQGEERQQLYYGYFMLQYGGKPHELHVYKDVPPHGVDPAARPQLSVWFTDETTGKETYHVGRYLNVGPESPDPNHLYTLDLNKAYNPWCAYSSRYTCAVPRREDHVGFAIRAGEMAYHQ
jgi:uncharacterized protein